MSQPKYLILAPNYVANSAGVWCLYNLCHTLNNMTQEANAFIVGSHYTTPHLNAPLFANQTNHLGYQRSHNIDKQEDIAIYPETTMGNPLGCKKVIRWVLNKPGFLGGESVYAKSEKVFYYSELYKAAINNEIAGKLYMPTLDESIFFPPTTEVTRGEEEYFYLGKATYLSGHLTNNHSVKRITRDTPPKSQLGNLFRKAKRLYSFDNYTALISEATYCGCPVTLIPEVDKTTGLPKNENWNDIMKQEMSIEGISWGMENTPTGQQVVNTAIIQERLNTIKAEFNNQMENLLQVMKNME